MTEELEAEGYAREIIRKIQAERKKQGMIKEDKIKVAIKAEISYLNDSILKLREELEYLKESQKTPTEEYKTSYEETQQTNKPTQNPTDNQPNYSLEGLKSQNITLSTGNEGVPTDKPTDKPTNQHPLISHGNTSYDDFHKATEILSSLDSIKKEIRLKFKRLTNQEMVVFSRLYSLEDQNIDDINHKTLALSLNLSESSIRDYINRLISKGIPIEKIRQNNKKISLKISENLKKVATLATIIGLRDL